MNPAFSSLLAIALTFQPGKAEQPGPAVDVPDIVLPVINPNLPKPVPPPLPPPAEIVKLPAGVLYCITSEKPFLVFASPADRVTITHDAGPLKIIGKFVEQPDVHQTRMFTQKYVVSVEAAVSGSCELMILSQGTTDEKQIIRRPLDVNVLPIPPLPEPVPPGPTPQPTPIPTSGFRVLFVFETASLTPQQSNTMNAASIRAYLATKCAKGDDGKTPEVRYFDKDVTLENASATWKQIWAATKPSDPAAFQAWAKTLPVVIIFDGLKGTSYPLPASASDLLALLKKAGG